MRVQLIVGTAKGAFLYSSDAERRSWTLSGPFLPGWKVSAVARDGADGYVLASSSFVYGAMVHKGDDLAAMADWTMAATPPRYSDESGFKLKEIWTLTCAEGGLYAGVDEAGLFQSTDHGSTWQEVTGLTGHATRGSWFPGFGGLCAHHVLAAEGRVWCGISAVGVFESSDGGTRWELRNAGVPVLIQDEQHEHIGCCVHAIVADPEDADRIWRQDHVGMFRSLDGGRSWTTIQDGLPSTFGFPLVRDHASGALFAVPLQSDEYRYPEDGKLRVFRSSDDGDSWQSSSSGLPDGSYHAVLRQAMACDQLGHHDPARTGGVYMANAGGEVFASADLGATWQRLPGSLPRALCLEVFVDEG